MAILDRCLYLAQSGITPEDFKKLVLKNMAISFALFLPLFLSSILLLFRLVPIRLPDVIPISLLVVSFVPLVASVILSFKPLLDGYIEIKQIERELPFVSAVLTLYAVSGMPPHVALNRFSTFQEVFPSTARMATRIEKLKQLFVLDDFAAIKKEAEIIGSDSVQDVLLSAIGTTRTGADLYVILRDKMRSSFTMLKESFVRLSETMKTMADVILILFGILPMMLFTMFSMFYSDTTLAQLRVYSFFFNPLMGIVVIAMVDSLYPKTPISYNKIYKRLLYWIPASLALSIVTWLMFQLVLNRVEYFSMYAITMTLFVGSFSLFFAEGLRF
jgi:flagellar protein FlaJ